MTRGLGGHSVSNITQHLKGIHMPADKQALVRQARQNGAEQDILQDLQNLPDQRFDTMADVMKALGQVE